MNKKGFTLIEIIVCLVLITTIGVTTVLVTKDNKKVDEDISQKILRAANIFVEVEKDDNGNNYLNEIVKGAKGVQIPVSMLVDKGYIDKSIETKLYKNTTKPNGQSYFVMFMADGNNYCDKSEITSLASWMVEEGKTIYLCNNYEKKDTNIFFLKENSKFKVDLTKYAVSEEFYNNASVEEKTYLTKDENGLYIFMNEEVGKAYYYFRGAVDNNYVKFGKDKDNNDLYWRILWLSDENKLKLVLDEEINLTAINYDGDEIEIKRGDRIQNLSHSHYGTYYLLNPIKTFIEKINGRSYYEIRYDEEGSDRLKGDELIFSTLTSYDSESLYTSKNIHLNTLNRWFDSTSLKDITYIEKNNNFCINYYRRDGTSVGTNFKPSENFDCLSGWYKDNDYVYNNNKYIYGSSVGFLTYGDAIRAGLSNSGSEHNSILSDSKNFLISKNGNSYILADHSSISELYGSKSAYLKLGFYYVTELGIKHSVLYERQNNYSGYSPKEGFTLIKPDGTTVYNGVFNHWDSFRPYIDTQEHNIETNSVKPVIILDITNLKFSGTGEYDDPYVLKN